MKKFIEMRLKWKPILYFLGGGLGLLGVVFVALRLHSYSETLDFNRFTSGTWSLILLLSIVYGAANLFLAAAWRKLILYFEVDISITQAIRLYGLSQLAKYVPGNIFHLAGRQALGMADGLPAKALAKSALWELGGIVLAGILFAPLVAPLVFESISVWLSLVIFSGVLLCTWTIVSRLFSSSVRDAIMLQCFFLMGSGIVFLVVLGVISPALYKESLLPALGGAYVISWLVGFVTPGAPAGVGVREIVLLFLLKDLVSEMDLLLAIILARAITVAGDFYFFFSSALINHENKIHK